MILSDNHPDDESWPGGVGPSEESGDTGEDKNSGTLLLDVTCAPQHIAFPQDINLLNESRENLKEIVDAVCYELKEQNPVTEMKI